MFIFTKRDNVSPCSGKPPLSVPFVSFSGEKFKRNYAFVFRLQRSIIPAATDDALANGDDITTKHVIRIAFRPYRYERTPPAESFLQIEIKTLVKFPKKK